MGCLRLPEAADGTGRFDRVEGKKIIDTAIRSEINLFDTAYTYQDGDSEKVLGEALSGYPRDSYMLSTKFYVAASNDIESVFEEQLERLQTDYVDFYLLHGVDENYIEAYMDEERDYLGYMLEQKRRGRIRHMGFSSHGAPETLASFLDWYSDFDMALIQLNYLDWTLLRAREQYEILTAHGIPVWVMEPLKGGRLSQLDYESAEVLKNAADDRTISSWGFRFLMGLPNVHTVLSGMSSVEQVMENAKTFEAKTPLDDAEEAALEKAAAVFKEKLGVPCSSCGYCCSVCPAGLDIPLLLRGYNEWRVSGKTWRVAALDTAVKPEKCLNCGACLKRCPQKIKIPEILAEFAERKEEQQ